MKLVLFFPKAHRLVWQDPPSRACDVNCLVLGAPVTDLFNFFFEKEKKVSPVGEFFFGFFSTSAFGRDFSSKSKIHDFVALFDQQDDPLRRTTDLP